MKKFFFFPFLAVVLSVSCDTTKEMTPPVNDISTTIVATSKNRTLSEAVAIAENGLDMFGVGSKTRGDARRIDFSNIRYKIDQTTRSGDADTLLYILNFADNQGFALIAANRGTEGLIALAESGSFDGNSTGNVGFDMYMDDTYQYLSSGVKAAPPIIGDIIHEQLERRNFVLEEAMVNPMTDVEWAQKAPFNIFCSSPYNKEIPAGCVATAIATAMSAYSYPSSINLTYSGRDRSSVNLDWAAMNSHNWNSCMLWNSCFTCETCRQIGYLFREIGKRVKMEYKVGSSEALIPGDVAPCLNSFGYTTGGYRDSYDNTTVCNSLRDGGIVIVRGESQQGGHAWVISGYKYIKTRNELYSRSTNDPLSTWELVSFLERSVWYVRFNYGWGGSNNMWVESAVYDFGQGRDLIGGSCDEWTRTIFTDKEGCNDRVGIIPNIKPI